MHLHTRVCRVYRRSPYIIDCLLGDTNEYHLISEGLLWDDSVYDVYRRVGRKGAALSVEVQRKTAVVAQRDIIGTEVQAVDAVACGRYDELVAEVSPQGLYREHRVDEAVMGVHQLCDPV